MIDDPEPELRLGGFVTVGAESRFEERNQVVGDLWVRHQRLGNVLLGEGRGDQVPVGAVSTQHLDLSMVEPADDDELMKAVRLG